MKISFAEPALPKTGALAVLATAEGQLLETAELVDKRLKGALARAAKTSRFTGEKGQSLELLAPAGLDVSRVILYGLGKPEQVGPSEMENLGGTLSRRLLKTGERQLTIACDALPGGQIDGAEAAARIGFGVRLGTYAFDKYHTKKPADEAPTLQSVAVAVAGAPAARRAFQPLDRVADGVCFARDLVTEPANVIYPESLAGECRSLEKLGVEVEVLGQAQMKRLGMGAILGVAQGSVREPQLVIMHWKGGAKRQAPVAFVGKGVCFDSGGLSLKGANAMEDMKWDMGGAASVIGAMQALAGRGAKANVVGVVGLVENMPAGNAQRPGDVVTSMSGQTIEVLNTDAEGRLVLADALWYTQDRFKPQFMVDLATLTGAIISALGHEYAGLFSNDDALAGRIDAAAKAEGESVWRMPLVEAYDKQLDSPIADMQNIGSERGSAGSSVGAQFLQRFVNKLPWAHLDIAGTAWMKKDRPTVPKGASGYGVRLLNRLVADGYEGK